MKHLFYFLILTTVSIPSLYAHHYKGLPHYSYFENYPQVPALEFIEETPEYEMFVTIYNYQGIDLDNVQSPDQVRLYTYIFDVKANKAFLGKIDFSLWSHDKEIHSISQLDPEQESIYIVQKQMKEQDDLTFKASFVGLDGKPVRIAMDIQITETLFQKYGLYISIGLFLILVMTIKVILNNKEATQKRNELKNPIEQPA